MAKKPSSPSKPATAAKPAKKSKAPPALKISQPDASPSRSPSPAAPDLNVQQAKAWSALCRIKTARTNAKTREAELIATRRDLNNQLNTLGAGSTMQHLKVSREFVVCERSIDAVRATIKTLADRMEHLVDDAMQGKLDDENIPTDAELFTRPSEEDLFRTAGDDDDEDGQLTLDDTGKKPRGGKRQPAVPDQPGLEVPEETDQHLKASIEELDLPEHTKAKLYKAGYRTIDALVRVVDDPEQDLQTVLNCEDAHAKAIKTALGAFRSRHRKAKTQAEKDAEAALAGGVPA